MSCSVPDVSNGGSNNASTSGPSSPPLRLIGRKRRRVNGDDVPRSRFPTTERVARLLLRAARRRRLHRASALRGGGGGRPPPRLHHHLRGRRWSASFASSVIRRSLGEYQQDGPSPGDPGERTARRGMRSPSRRRRLRRRVVVVVVVVRCVDVVVRRRWWLRWWWTTRWRLVGGGGGCGGGGMRWPGAATSCSQPSSKLN